MKDITHIERSNLPWRDERATECGLDRDRHPTWTRDEAIAKAREMGKQRFAMVVCMTCMNTAERHRTWDEDPVSCMDRYASRWNDHDRPKLTAELRAMALLVEVHRAEFDDAVTALTTATPMADLRAARKARR